MKLSPWLFLLVFFLGCTPSGKTDAGADSRAPELLTLSGSETLKDMKILLAKYKDAVSRIQDRIETLENDYIEFIIHLIEGFFLLVILILGFVSYYLPDFRWKALKALGFCILLELALVLCSKMVPYRIEISISAAVLVLIVIAIYFSRHFSKIKKTISEKIT
jgi:hypothetical protein